MIVSTCKMHFNCHQVISHYNSILQKRKMNDSFIHQWNTGNGTAYILFRYLRTTDCDVTECEWCTTKELTPFAAASSVCVTRPNIMVS